MLTSLIRQKLRSKRAIIDAQAEAERISRAGKSEAWLCIYAKMEAEAKGLFEISDQSKLKATSQVVSAAGGDPTKKPSNCYNRETSRTYELKVEAVKIFKIFD